MDNVEPIIHDIKTDSTFDLLQASVVPIVRTTHKLLKHCLRIFVLCPPQVKDTFSRAAQRARQLGTFLPSLLLFLRTKLGPWLAGLEEGQAVVGRVGQEELLGRLLAAEQVNGVSGC